MLKGITESQSAMLTTDPSTKRKLSNSSARRNCHSCNAVLQLCVCPVYTRYSNMLTKAINEHAMKSRSTQFFQCTCRSALPFDTPDFLISHLSNTNNAFYRTVRFRIFILVNLQERLVNFRDFCILPQAVLLKETLQQQFSIALRYPDITAKCLHANLQVSYYIVTEGVFFRKKKKTFVCCRFKCHISENIPT